MSRKQVAYTIQTTTDSIFLHNLIQSVHMSIVITASYHYRGFNKSWQMEQDTKLKLHIGGQSKTIKRDVQGEIDLSINYDYYYYYFPVV